MCTNETEEERRQLFYKRLYRELELVELEFQKPIQANWKDATVSERPILVLDRDGGNFYRYYEYRIVKGTKFLGAIRIPAYRRTEYFFTSEVRLYFDDEKVTPTRWGQYMREMAANSNTGGEDGACDTSGCGGE